jgi:hypothetical protein
MTAAGSFALAMMLVAPIAAAADIMAVAGVIAASALVMSVVGIADSADTTVIVALAPMALRLG